jgi:mitochondrial fission protein ELM1
MTVPSRAFACWVVTDGRAGNENQALGLAEAVARLTPLDITVKRIVLKPPWRRLPRAFWGEPFTLLSSDGALLRPPFPQMWIACGRISTPFTQAVKKIHAATFTIQLQNPHAPLERFDLVVPALHDGLHGENVFSILGSPNRVTKACIERDAEMLAPALSRLPSPRVAVLLGGPNRAYAMNAANIAEIATVLRALADDGAGLMITASRRTPEAATAAVRAALNGTNHFFWNGAPVAGLSNPYFGMLGLADHVVATKDSVNMAAEAAMTAKPVHVLALDRRLFASAAKFEGYHSALRDRGVARPVELPLQSWNYVALDETARAAEEVMRRLRARD